MLYPKASWRGKRLFCLYSHILAHHWRKSGQEPGHRIWCRSCKGVLLTGLLSIACSVCFPIEARMIRPEVAPPIIGWALPHQSLIKNMPYRLTLTDPTGPYSSPHIATKPNKIMHLEWARYEKLPRLDRGTQQNKMRSQHCGEKENSHGRSVKATDIALPEEPELTMFPGYFSWRSRLTMCLGYFLTFMIVKN